MNQQRQQDASQIAAPGPIPNYPAITERHFVTQMYYPHIDAGANPPLAHTTGELAKAYAQKASERARVDVEVFVPACMGGQKLATFREGTEITTVADGKPKQLSSSSPIG